MASSLSTPPPTPSITSSTSSSLLRSDFHHLLNEALHLPRKDRYLAHWLFTPPDAPPQDDLPILSPTIFNLSHALLAEAHHPNCPHNLPHNATLGRPIPLHPVQTTPTPPKPSFCMNRHQLFIPAQLFHHYILGYTLDSGAPHLFALTTSPPPAHPFPVLGKFILDLSAGTLLTYSPSRPLSRACLKYSKGLSSSARTCHSLLLPLLDYSPDHLPSDVLCIFTSIYQKRTTSTPPFQTTHLNPTPPPPPSSPPQSTSSPFKRHRPASQTTVGTVPAEPAAAALVTGALPPLNRPAGDAHVTVLDDITPSDYNRKRPFNEPTDGGGRGGSGRRAWRKREVRVLFDLRKMMRGGGRVSRRAGRSGLEAEGQGVGKGETPFDVGLMRESLEDLEEALEGRFYCSRVRFAAVDPWTGRCVERVGGGLAVVIVTARGKEEGDMRREAMLEYYKAVLAVDTDGKLGGGGGEEEEEEEVEGGER